MTHERDIEPILDHWLADGPSEAPDRVFDAVADRIERQPQRPAWRFRWKDSRPNNFLKPLAALAAVVVVAVVGFNLVGKPAGSGTGAFSTSTSGPATGPTRSPLTPTQSPPSPSQPIATDTPTGSGGVASVLASCGEVRFETGALDGSVVVATPPTEAVAAMALELGIDPGSIGAARYRPVLVEADHVLFAKPTPGEERPFDVIALDRVSGAWRLDFKGACYPRVVLQGTALDGLGPADWWLDPAAPAPAAADRQLKVLVHELAACITEQAGTRVAPPFIKYAEESVTLTFGVTPLAGAPQECDAIGGDPILSPYVVTLAEALGGRALLDGGVFPPRDATRSPDSSPTPSGPPQSRPPATAGLIAFVFGPEGKSDLALFAPDGSSDSIRTCRPGSAPSWSADGHTLVFAGPDTPIAGGLAFPDVYRVAADCTGVTNVIKEGTAPHLSPDGAWITFGRGVIDTGDAWIAKADGSGARKLMTGTSPTWSPDGSWLLLNPGGATFELGLVRPDGTGYHALAPGYDASWTPDGRIVYLRSDSPKDTATLRVIALDGTATDLFTASGEIGSPRMLASGRVIFVWEGDLWRLDPGSKDPFQLTQGLTAVTGPSASSDGKWAALGVGGTKPGLVIVSIDGGPVLRAPLDGPVLDVAWQPVGSATTQGPSPTPDLAEVPDHLDVACDSSTTAVPMAVARSRPDGLYVAIADTDGQRHGLEIDGVGSLTPGAGGMVVVDQPPGPLRVRCTSATSSSEGPWVDVLLVDPAALYVPAALECGTGGALSRSIDYAPGTAGQKGDPRQLAEKALKGLRAGDLVEDAGYPLAETRRVRVVRDGLVVALVSFQPDGRGGWLAGGTQACAGSDIVWP